MVQYYNLSSLADGGYGYMHLFKSMSVMTNYYLAYLIIAIVFLVPIIYSINRGDKINDAVAVSSLYSLILCIFLYVIQIIINPILIFSFAIIFIATTLPKWFNRQ
jgi:hypothetical protein